MRSPVRFDSIVLGSGPLAPRHHQDPIEPEPMVRTVCGDVIGTLCAVCALSDSRKLKRGKRERARQGTTPPPILNKNQKIYAAI